MHREDPHPPGGRGSVVRRIVHPFRVRVHLIRDVNWPAGDSRKHNGIPGMNLGARWTVNLGRIRHQAMGGFYALQALWASTRHMGFILLVKGNILSWEVPQSDSCFRKTEALRKMVRENVANCISGSNSIRHATCSSCSMRVTLSWWRSIWADFSFLNLGLYLWHMEVPGPGVKSELQLLAYTIATATARWNVSHICELHHNAQLHQILNPLSEARDQTHILKDTSQAPNPLSHSGNSPGWLTVLPDFQTRSKEELELLLSSLGMLAWDLSHHAKRMPEHLQRSPQGEEFKTAVDTAELPADNLHQFACHGSALPKRWTSAPSWAIPSNTPCYRAGLTLLSLAKISHSVAK